MWGFLHLSGRGLWMAAAVMFSVLVVGCKDSASSSSSPSAESAATQATAMAEQQAYPLDVCVVSGGKLGAMGDPVIYHYEGREVRFCCSSCVKKFEADPAKYLAKLDAAIAKASENAPAPSVESGS